MRRGGVVGFQEGGYADELKDFGQEGLEQEYEDEQDSFGIGDALRYPFEHPIQSASALALTKMFGPKMARDAMRWKNIPSAWGTARGAIGKATEGLGSLLRSGAGMGKYNPARWASEALTRPWSSTPSKSTAWIRSASEANRALGRRGLGRGILGGLAGIGTTLGFWPSGDEDGDEVIPPVADQGERPRRPSGEGAGRSPSQDIFEQIETYRTLAGIPTEAEKNQNKLDVDRAKSLGGYRAGIAALRPTDEQYRLRGRGVGFGALSRVLARTGDPSKRQDFGQMGEAIRGETDRQLAERLGFEDKLAGIDTSIYGVESGSLGRQALRSRAGQAYDMPHLQMMMQEMRDEAAHERAVEIANINLGGRNQALIGRLYAALGEAMSNEQRQMILEQIQMLGGGGSSGGVGGLSGLMEQAQGAG
jgi:hypothetical protein